MGLGYADGLHLFLVPQRGARMMRLAGCIAVTKCGNVAKRPCLDRSLAANRSAAAAGEATPIVFENQRHGNLRC